MTAFKSHKDGQHAIERALDMAASFILLAGTLLFPIFYLPFTNDVINLPKSMFLYAATFLLLLIWLFRSVLTKQIVMRRTVLDLSLAAFALVVLFSAVLSLVPSISFLGKTGDFVLHVSSMLAMMVWFYALVQYVKDSRGWRTMVHTILLAGILAGSMFIFRGWDALQPVINAVGFNTVSNSNSVFAMYMAVIGIIGMGLLLVKGRSIVSQIIPGLALAVSVFVLLKSGFTIGWVIFAIGFALLVVLGVSMVAQTHMVMLSLSFFLFLASLLLVFIGTPAAVKTQLPVEVALGAQPSWSIAQDAFLATPKTFLLGSGPGTFTQDFSLYRSASFNASDVAWAVRFEHPFNTFFGILAELGLLGVISFILLILLSIGSMLSAWLKIRPSAVTKKAFQEKHEDDPIMLEAFVLVAGLIAVTVGMAMAFYDLAMWWLWWTLLAGTVIGLSAYVSSFVSERRISLKVSPQYTLVTSFGMIFIITAIVVAGIFGGRVYSAEMSFEKAVREGNPNNIRSHLQEAVRLRPGYAPYMVSLAQSHLERAVVESRKPDANAEVIIDSMGKAINTAKQATDMWGNDVETWQTLAVMYQSAESFTPDAVDWSIDAYKRAIELEPTNPLLHCRLAQVYTTKGSYDDAEDSLIESIRLKPDYFPAYFDLSALYESQREYTLAIELHEPIFERISNNSEALFGLGRLYYNRAAEGDLERAEMVWNRAIELTPNYVNALYSMGLLYERVSDQQKALSFFNRAKEVSPDDPEIDARVRALLAPVPEVAVEEPEGE